MTDKKVTERLLPVMLGSQEEYVISTAVVVEEPSITTVTIAVHGDNARILGGFLTAAEPIALSFTGIPVQPRKRNIKE